MADSNAFGGRRETLRADWIRRISSLVSRHSVRRLTILETLIPVAESSVFCHAFFFIFDVPRLGVAIIMPTLAQLVVAPPCSKSYSVRWTFWDVRKQKFASSGNVFRAL